MNETNYYQVLGVSHDAEDFVIRAAYKAQTQRYHPDKYRGSKDEGMEKIYLINEAYRVLSNQEKRQEYDLTLQENYQNNTFHSQYKNEGSLNDYGSWEIAIKYHPNVAEYYERLKKISDELAINFKSTILENQAFEEAEFLAQNFENKYLEEHFGSNTKVLKFARDLLLDGHKQAAQELNATLITLGDSMPFNEVYIEIQKKYRPEMYAKQKQKAQDKRKARERQSTEKEGNNKEDVVKKFRAKITGAFLDLDEKKVIETLNSEEALQLSELRRFDFFAFYESIYYDLIELYGSHYQNNQKAENLLRLLQNSDVYLSTLQSKFNNVEDKQYKTTKSNDEPPWYIHSLLLILIPLFILIILGIVDL